MGCDITIALANDKRHNYAELRMALRSIDHFLTGHRDIYLIGEKPSWVRNIIHIPAKDEFSRKQYNIYRKFLIAAQAENVSENFIRWDDDVYLLQPLDVSQIKDWHEGTLKDWTTKNINTLYRNVVKNTLKLFHDGLYYDIHAPRVFNKEKYRELSKYNWGNQELLTKSTYFNSFPSNPVEMSDPKLVKGIFHSSTGKLGYDENKMLTALFPNPCKYEADYNANAKATLGMAEAER